MYHPRIALVVIGDSDFGSHFAGASIIKPEVQAKWVGQATHKTVLGIGLKGTHRGSFSFLSSSRIRVKMPD
jgi:hypothetical protein